MTRNSLFAICAAIACAAVWIAPKTIAAEPKPHQHGQASLRVTVEGQTLRLALEGPLDSFLGFERAPRNERERAAVQAMARELRAVEKHFVPSAQAGCKVAEVALESEVLDRALLSGAAGASSPAKSAGGANRDAGGHADIDATCVFRCAQPGALRELQVNLFDAFRGLTRIDAQVAAPGRQAGASLSAGSRKLSW